MKNAIKQLFIAGLFALATLLSAVVPTHANTAAEIQADVLQSRILAAIQAQDYAAADRLFGEYDATGVLNMPPPLQLQRGVVYARLQQFYKAELELTAYLQRVERGSADYNTAVALLAEIAPKAAADSAGKAQVQAELRAAAAGEAARVAALEPVAAAFARETFMPLSVTARDGDGWTLLHYAALDDDNLAAAEWLLANGADVNAKSEAGNTPLHYAARKDSRAVAELLLANGADVNAKRNGGGTPLDIAILRDSDAVAALLRQHGGRCNKFC